MHKNVLILIFKFIVAWSALVKIRKLKMPAFVSIVSSLKIIWVIIIILKCAGEKKDAFVLVDFMRNLATNLFVRIMVKIKI